MMDMVIPSWLYSSTWQEPGSFFLMVWFLFIEKPFIITPENPIYPFGINN